MYAGKKENRFSIRLSKRIALKAFGNWELCSNMIATPGASKTALGVILTPFDTNDPGGTLAVGLEYDTSSSWNNMYFKALIHKVTVIVKVFNNDVAQNMYFWMYVSDDAAGARLSTGDGFDELCGLPRLKYMIIKKSTATNTNTRFYTMKYTVYMKEFLNSRGTHTFPKDASHVLNTTAPAFNPKIHTGFTTYNGVAFPGSQTVDLSFKIYAKVALFERREIE